MAEAPDPSPASTETSPEVIQLLSAWRQLVHARSMELQGGSEQAVDEGIIAMERAIQVLLLTLRRRRTILSFVQDTLTQFRLDMKYLIFDLEATRRERDALQERLEGKE